MFHEERDIVSKLKVENAHFHSLFEKHNDLDNKIDLNSEKLPDIELENLKKEKLKLKDELFAMIQDYKSKNA